MEEDQALECNPPTASLAEAAREAEGKVSQGGGRDEEEFQELLNVFFGQRQVVRSCGFYDDELHVTEPSHRGDLGVAHGAVLS